MNIVIFGESGKNRPEADDQKRSPRRFCPMVARATGVRSRYPDELFIPGLAEAQNL
jgi:hypothetical protein